MLPLTQYVEQHRSTKNVPAGIRERWQTRVVPRGLHQLGEAGAAHYLADYGRGISAQKVIDLARCAEQEGCRAMARGFWRKAYTLDMGQEPPAEEESEPQPTAPGGAGAAPVAEPAQTPAAPPRPRVAGLPDHLQPGDIHTMQPVDADQDREHYIRDGAWWGQPKRDGERRVIIVTPDQVFYQARSTSLNGPPSPEIDAALRAVAALVGTFILDGEVYYPDVLGQEHRTGAQAATVNVRVGQGHVQPAPAVAIFKALYEGGIDLTGRPEWHRIAIGEAIGHQLVTLAPASFEVLPTARTAAEKRALVEQQQAEGREGEVWVCRNCSYRGGKDQRGKPIVRTKYVRTLDVVVLKLTLTRAAGRPFGAIEVGWHADGRLVSLGKVGTGFDAGQMAEIARRHAATPGQVVATITCQGFTEGGQVWLGRFESLRDDKHPADCTAS